MVLAVVLILLFLLLIYLLVAPLVLYIDTVSNTYYFQYKGVAKATVLADEKEVIKIRLHVFFIRFNFYPLRKKKEAVDSKRIENGESARKRKKSINLKTGLRLLKSFKIRKFLIDIDTGDCIANAKLYPFFAFLNYRLGGFRINFEGRNQLILEMQNRPIYLIKSFINS